MSNAQVSNASEKTMGDAKSGGAVASVGGAGAAEGAAGGGLAPTIFHAAYEAEAPWDIGAAQPAIVEVEAEGHIRGPVLDAGCGTADNAIYLAKRGHEVFGFDFVPRAIELARGRAEAAGARVHLAVGDALNIAFEHLHAPTTLDGHFATVIDCGLFHVFGDARRERYVDELRRVTRPSGMVVVLCFSHEQEGEYGPRRIHPDELSEAFREGFAVREVRKTRFRDRVHESGARALLALIERVA